MTFDHEEPSANSPCTKTTFFVFGDGWELATWLSKGRAAPAAKAPINVRRSIIVSCYSNYGQFRSYGKIHSWRPFSSGEVPVRILSVVSSGTRQPFRDRLSKLNQ